MGSSISLGGVSTPGLCVSWNLIFFSSFLNFFYIFSILFFSFFFLFFFNFHRLIHHSFFSPPFHSHLFLSPPLPPSPSPLPPSPSPSPPRPPPLSSSLSITSPFVTICIFHFFINSYFSIILPLLLLLSITFLPLPLLFLCLFPLPWLLYFMTFYLPSFLHPNNYNI